MTKLVILHIAALSFKKSSGLTTSVPELVNAQNSVEGVNTALVISKGSKPKRWEPDFNVYEFNKDFNKLSLKDLPNPYNNPDLVIFHSTYIPIHANFALKLRKRAIPYIIVPRGGMTKQSGKNKVLKKRLGNILFFKKFVNNSTALHCLTEGESEETAHWRKRIFVVGNGMHLPNNPNKLVNKENKSIRFVFIGRLDPYHKGLDIFISACAEIGSILKKEDCKIEIYGPDINGSSDILIERVKEANLEETIEILPPVYGEEKEKILRKTDVFFHTSRFEGHPMSVLEALSYGIPCLLTPGTNISEDVQRAGAGWEVELSPKGIAEGIKNIILNKDIIKDMSDKSIKLVEDKYAWRKIAKDTIKQYRSLIE